MNNFYGGPSRKSCQMIILAGLSGQACEKLISLSMSMVNGRDV
jgi:hypothetical protein